VQATVLHHTWSPTAAQYRGRETIVGIRRFHMAPASQGGRGFSDIAANAYACPDGTVVTGRPLSTSNWAHALISRSDVEAEARALAAGDKQFFNSYGFGLETVANFDEEDPFGSGPARQSFLCALAVLSLVHRTWNLSANRLFFHRDVADKSCPGTKLYRPTVRRLLERSLTMPQVDVSDWAQAAVERIVAEGLMTRNAEGKFRGTEPVTREELAVVLDRLLAQPK
jgi:hypothetical protein